MGAPGRVTRLAAVACRAAAAAAGLLWVCCAEFPVRYERIDSDQSRTLDFVFTNLSDTTARLCEAAPGDSMLLVCYFAGVPTQTVTFDVSWNVYISPYGEDSAFDRGPLPHVVVPFDSAAFTDSTDVVAIRFAVPRNVLQNSSSVDEGAIQSFLSQAASAYGVPIHTKAELLDSLDTLARMSPSERAAHPLLHGAMQLFGTMVAQMISAPIRIFVTVNGVNRIASDVTVRYNRLLRDYPGVRINRNPGISFVGIYKVKGSAVGFGPANLNADDTTYCLYAAGGVADRGLMGDTGNIVWYPDSIVVDKGYSYYMATDSGVFAGVEGRDTAVALFYDIQNGALALGTDTVETYFQRWFYQLDAAEAADMEPNDMFIIANGSRCVTPMLTSLKPSITHLTLWVQVYDYFLGEWNRPYGSTLMESKLAFKYTQAYRDSLGW